MDSAELPVLSFVLPAYSEADKTDATDSVLEAMAVRDGPIRPIHLSRKFGHMAAVTARLGAARATGAVICLDSESQQPPELIPEMVARWEGAGDIIQTVRILREEASRG